MNNQPEENTITALHQLQTSQNHVVVKAAELLGRIGATTEAISTLIHLVRTVPDEPTRWVVIQTLGKIGVGNSEVISNFIEQLSISQIPTRRIIAQNLSRIAVGNLDTITTLANLVKTSEDEITRQSVVYTLGRIGNANLEAINTLTFLIFNSPNYYTRAMSVWSLRQIDTSSKDTIYTLINFIGTAKYPYGYAAIPILQEFTVGNRKVIQALTQMLQSKNLDEHNRELINTALNVINPHKNVAWLKIILSLFLLLGILAIVSKKYA